MSMMGSSYRRGLQGKARAEGAPVPKFDELPTEGPVTALDPDLDMDEAVASALEKVREHQAKKAEQSQDDG